MYREALTIIFLQRSILEKCNNKFLNDSQKSEVSFLENLCQVIYTNANRDSLKSCPTLLTVIKKLVITFL